MTAWRGGNSRATGQERETPVLRTAAETVKEEKPSGSQDVPVKTEPPTPPRCSDDHDRKSPLDTKTSDEGSKAASVSASAAASADAEASGAASVSASSPPSVEVCADESAAAESGGEPGRKKRKIRHQQTMEAMQEALDRAMAERDTAVKDLTATKERSKRAEDSGASLWAEKQNRGRGRG